MRLIHHLRIPGAAARWERRLVPFLAPDADPQICSRQPWAHVKMGQRQDLRTGYAAMMRARSLPMPRLSDSLRPVLSARDLARANRVAAPSDIEGKLSSQRANAPGTSTLPLRPHQTQVWASGDRICLVQASLLSRWQWHRSGTHYHALCILANRLVGILHGCLPTHTLYNEHLAWHNELDKLSPAA